MFSVWPVALTAEIHLVDGLPETGRVGGVCPVVS
jgi:hypothetical protein